MVIIPAFNEQAAIGTVIAELQEVLPGVPVLVIDDCSTDGTKELARACGAGVLPLPHRSSWATTTSSESTATASTTHAISLAS